jgi:hypothetical protein
MVDVAGIEANIRAIPLARVRSNSMSLGCSRFHINTIVTIHNVATLKAWETAGYTCVARRGGACIGLVQPLVSALACEDGGTFARVYTGGR